MRGISERAAGVRGLFVGNRRRGFRRPIERLHRPPPIDQRIAIGARQRQPRLLGGDGAIDIVHQLGARHIFAHAVRSEEHTSELQSLMRISYAVFCLKKKNKTTLITTSKHFNTTYTKSNTNNNSTDLNHKDNQHKLMMPTNINTIK